MILIIGTSHRLLLNPNDKRKRLRIQVQTTNVDANNTGKVFVGFGHQPVATVGHPSQGDVLLQGDGIIEPGENSELNERYKQAVWAISDTAKQSVIVEEEI